MHVFFDLDGTLTDSCPGIIRCIDHALVELGYPHVAEEHLRGMIGAPLSTIFETLLRSSEPDLLDRAVAAYRVRFDRTGIFENCLFPGVVEALTTLRQAGHSLQIVTAKPAVAARRVVEHFEIGRFFEAVHGPDLDERLFEKARLLETAVRGVPAGQSVMVGDRADDVRAAHACGVQAVAAAWGYGAREELRAANPTYVAESMAELVDWAQQVGRGRWPRRSAASTKPPYRQ